MSIARFTRISRERYGRELPEGSLPWEELALPRRATAGSAGYDFISPAEVTVPPGGEALIPTGIRAEMEAGWVLLILPRSGLGFRHGLRLSNTAGVIDSDYAHAENEGHILVKLRNPSDHPVEIRRGDRFCQGIFVPYGTAEEEEEPPERTGGIGSTGR